MMSDPLPNTGGSTDVPRHGPRRRGTMIIQRLRINSALAAAPVLHGAYALHERHARRRCSLVLGGSGSFSLGIHTVTTCPSHGLGCEARSQSQGPWPL